MRQVVELALIVTVTFGAGLLDQDATAGRRTAATPPPPDPDPAGQDGFHWTE
ncbi:MAG: hypothetical protein JJT81_14685 [Rubellimicrobium sp.]|nr:hypothetical protein [Rubellimicrobium sp.]